MSVKIKSTGGGSVDLVIDASLATDEVLAMSSTEVQVKSPDGSVWAIRVDDAGAITTTKV